MKANTKVEARKRIVVACDGTWKDSDGEYQVPSNVTRICRCIKQEAKDSTTGAVIPQIIYYQSGVGTESTIYNKVVGGSTGQGGPINHCRCSCHESIANISFRTGRKYSRSL
jgi:Uncharacterized alpha/beta hydrolase domain (DUF2235)